MQIDREELLANLERLLPGVSQRETFAQSSCFVFFANTAYAMQLRVACSMPSPFADEVEGAVPATKLIDALALMKHQTIKVTQKKDQLVVQPAERKKGEREVIRIDMDLDLQLPINLMPTEHNWAPLDPAFGDAIKAVTEIKARKADVRPLVHCVHIHPDYIEATNGNQAIRWRIPTPVPATVVQVEDVKGLAWLRPKQVSVSDRWMSFDVGAGLVYSCHCDQVSVVEYPDLSHLFVIEGTKVVLPRGLVDASKLGEVFSKADDDHNHLTLGLSPGKLVLCGFGPQGEYTHERDVDYDGPEMEFYVNPERLRALAERHTECVITEGRLAVRTADYEYVTSLVACETVETGK